VWGDAFTVYLREALLFFDHLSGNVAKMPVSGPDSRNRRGTGQERAAPGFNRSKKPRVYPCFT
jgi:hypothetical protein